MSAGSYRQRTTGGYMMTWRVPKDIHPRKDLAVGVPLAVVEFEGKATPAWFYGTNGMGALGQGEELPLVRTEVCAVSDARCPWAISLLDGLARYPFQHGLRLGPFDVIESGLIDGGKGNTTFDALLLVPASLGGGLPQDQVAAWDDGAPVDVLQAIAVYLEELPHIEHMGAQVFYARFLAQFEGRVDRPRPKLVPPGGLN